ncbi:UNVERIFIED_CONTAM: hypothetical protein FKN15_066303 [Acipenser sinensis]
MVGVKSNTELRLVQICRLNNFTINPLDTDYFIGSCGKVVNSVQVQDVFQRSCCSTSLVSVSSGNPGAWSPSWSWFTGLKWDSFSQTGGGGQEKDEIVKPCECQLVAVKVIDKTKLDSMAAGHLLQEVRCMKLVQHPNVVRLYEVIDTQTKLYLILELGDGGDMYDYIMRHEGGVSEDLAKVHFAQIVCAISYCHRLHVVHRDLKPENVVFFRQQGTVKLTDFGFSNRFQPGTMLMTSCGSLAYSAPEILLGEEYDAPAVGYNGRILPNHFCSVALLCLPVVLTCTLCPWQCSSTSSSARLNCLGAGAILSAALTAVLIGVKGTKVHGYTLGYQRIAGEQVHGFPLGYQRVAGEQVHGYTLGYQRIAGEQVHGFPLGYQRVAGEQVHGYTLGYQRIAGEQVHGFPLGYQRVAGEQVHGYTLGYQRIAGEQVHGFPLGYQRVAGEQVHGYTLGYQRIAGEQVHGFPLGYQRVAGEQVHGYTLGYQRIAGEQVHGFPLGYQRVAGEQVHGYTLGYQRIAGEQVHGFPLGYQRVAGEQVHGYTLGYQRIAGEQVHGFPLGYQRVAGEQVHGYTLGYQRIAGEQVHGFPLGYQRVAGEQVHGYTLGYQRIAGEQVHGFPLGYQRVAGEQVHGYTLGYQMYLEVILIALLSQWVPLEF